MSDIYIKLKGTVTNSYQGFVEISENFLTVHQLPSVCVCVCTETNRAQPCNTTLSATEEPVAL